MSTLPDKDETTDEIKDETKDEKPKLLTQEDIDQEIKTAIEQVCGTRSSARPREK